MKNKPRFFIKLTLAAALLGGAVAFNLYVDRNIERREEQPEIQSVLPLHYLPAYPDVRSVYGSYLSSHYAQSINDWSKADDFLNDVIKENKDDTDLLRRSLILAAGSGDVKAAAKRAEALRKLEASDGISDLVLIVRDIDAGDYDDARGILATLPEGAMTDFVRPLLSGWISAGQKEFDKTTMSYESETSIHQYHYALMAYFLGQQEAALEILETMLTEPNVTLLESDRIADLLAVLGRTEQALVLYEKLQGHDYKTQKIEAKIDAIKRNEVTDPLLFGPIGITSPKDGAAQALYDMAFVLYQEQSQTSARLFVSLALVLDPDLVDARFLFADALVAGGRFDEAISQLMLVPEADISYVDTRRYIAELMAEAGRLDDARDVLNKLFIDHNDVKSIIQIGDLYRQEKEYSMALEAYDKAFVQLGDDVPEDYWYLFYARGMTLEREGKWAEAERDLKAALAYRPDHPYLLNYLGYGWAEQGVELEKALELIEQAAMLRPYDGYIADSLGWVLYRMGRYREAIPHLENAVELLPYDTTVNDHLGDAYWKVGRRTEARFQWQRALNNAEEEDAELKTSLQQKLKTGLSDQTKEL